MLTQSEVWQGKLEAHQQRIFNLETRVHALEQFNQVRDQPRPPGIKEDLALLCRGINVDAAALLKKSDDGFRGKRKGIIIQLVRRGWSQSAVASLFNRDVRSIRRLTLKSTWKEKRK